MSLKSHKPAVMRLWEATHPFNIQLLQLIIGKVVNQLLYGNIGFIFHWKDIIVQKADIQSGNLTINRFPCLISIKCDHDITLHKQQHYSGCCPIAPLLIPNLRGPVLRRVRVVTDMAAGCFLSCETQSDFSRLFSLKEDFTAQLS